MKAGAISSIGTASWNPFRRKRFDRAGPIPILRRFIPGKVGFNAPSIRNYRDKYST